MGKAIRNTIIFCVVVWFIYAQHWFGWVNGPINATDAWISRESGGAVAWVGGWFGHGGKQRLGAAEIVARTEPAVYRVISGGNVELISPQAIRLTPGNPTTTGGGLGSLYNYVPPLVVQAYQAARAGGTTFGESRGSYCWDMLMSNPSRYLRYSGEGTVTVEARRVVLGTATAFAVSPKGVLVTNAHVVANGNIATSVGGASEAQRLLRFYVEEGPLAASLQEIQKGIGSPCPANLRIAVAATLLHYLLIKSRITEPFTRIVVMLNYRPDAVPRQLFVTPFWVNPDALSSILRDKSPPGLARIIAGDTSTTDRGTSEALKWLTVDRYVYAPGSKFVGYYARVLTKGSPYPGKDIAILQLDNATIGASLICLPLADSGNFALGSQVRCFGFPAVAVQKQTMKTSAQYQVTAMDATIDSVEATKFGWSAFHMESFINEGDSGGPEIDRYGRVVAINDAGRPGTGQDWSVPSNLVKAFLQKAGIKPHIGGLTKLWFRGQKLFWAKHYRRAEAIFYRVLKMQCGADLRPSPKYGTIPVTAAAGKRVTINNGVARASMDGKLLTFKNPFLNLGLSRERTNVPPLANWYVLAAVADCQRQLQKH